VKLDYGNPLLPKDQRDARTVHAKDAMDIVDTFLDELDELIGVQTPGKESEK